MLGFPTVECKSVQCIGDQTKLQNFSAQRRGRNGARGPQDYEAPEKQLHPELKQGEDRQKFKTLPLYIIRVEMHREFLVEHVWNL